MVLNNLITEEIYNTKKEEIEKELKACIVEIEMHDNADTDFKQALTTAFYLASKSYDLFICSHTQCGVAKHEEKRRLINFVFSNIQLTGKKVSYTLCCPFDIMAKMNHNEDWLPLSYTLRTKRREDVINFVGYLQGIQGLQLAV